MQQVFRKTFKFVVFLSYICFIGAIQEDEGLLVQLSHGKLRGKDNGYYFSYESIPYAEPPIGELRFESPQPYAQQWENVFDATHSPVACMQWNQYARKDDKLEGQEDCLTMNIYKPKLANESSNALLPVLVDIHGGAFMFGLPTRFQVTNLMQSGKFIVAKFAYRLGPLGFLSAEDNDLPGNYGLKDQRLALQWIKQNIGKFGGDPTNILVIGFSSGGVAVHLQMLRPDFKSIAKAAVSISGTALVPWAITHNARTRAFEMAKHLNCPVVETSADIKKCLKTKNAADIVRDVQSFLVFGYNPFVTFGPVVEPTSVVDAFITQTPEEIIKSGNFTQIPWLASYVAEDGAYNAAELLKKSPRREELIEVFNERWYDLAPYALFYKDTYSSIEELDDHSTALKKRYLGDKEFSIETYYDVQRMYTDVFFKNGVQRAVELHKNFNAPVYAYKYDNPSEESLAFALANRTDFKFGTVHGDDFTLILPNTDYKMKLREDQVSISKKFVKMLEDFIQNDELAYDNCKFVNNVGQEKLALMVITKDACENKYFDELP